MSQLGFFDVEDRYASLSHEGDPLERINEVVDWTVFMPLISRAFMKQHKSAGGRKPYNRLMMFKLLVLQSLYNLSDYQLSYQVRDRLSFIRFLGLGLNDKVPDEKTIWSYREVLVQGGMIEKLFDLFNRYLTRKGFAASCGTIVDASIVPIPTQRNSKDENKEIKSGKTPERFKENKAVLRQKDVDARWTKKQMQNYYGYKDHIAVDVKHKLIRGYTVSPANMADINCLEAVLSEVPSNDSNRLWADSAYYSEAMEHRLAKLGYESRIVRRYGCHHDRWSAVGREMARRSKVRKRVEHAFGLMQNSLGGKFIRTIGLVRARAKIGLMNLAHNIRRYEQLCRVGVS